MSEETSISEVRVAIDAIDQELVRLLARRQQLVEQAGHLKRGQGCEAIRAPSRVEHVIRTRRAAAIKAGLDADVAEQIWRSMIAAFIGLELDLQQDT